MLSGKEKSMGRQMILRDKRKVNFELDTKDFMQCYRVMARHGLTISEFGRDAFIRYAEELELATDLKMSQEKISLVANEIEKHDPNPQPEPIEEKPANDVSDIIKRGI